MPSSFRVAIVVAGFVGCLPAPARAENRAPVAQRHPVLQHGLDPKRAGQYERAVARVMAMDEAEMLRLVPTRSAIRFCGCPNCSGGQQESEQFHWTIERPFELRCRFCDHVYPSRKYPSAETAEGENALGEKVKYHYYLDANTGRDYWLEARADYLRREWFIGQCLRLAEAYHATGKAQYARRAGLILDRFAESYPHMAVLRQWPYRRRGIAQPTPPHPLAGGKWGRWMESEIPSQLPQAYDLICPLHDTWANSHRLPARQHAACTVLPAWGHAALGSGSGPDQIQAHLQFSAARGHRHPDNLSLALFAKGAEIASDIGYTHSKLRGWTTSTLAHNTVAIDRKNQTTGDADGDLLLFVPDVHAGRAADSAGGGLASVVEARGERGYAKLAECYRRQLLLVRVAPTEAYVVDVFRVRGGATHDWLLHGSANEEMTATCPLAMVPCASLLEAGEKWVEPVGESSALNPYGLMREIRQGRTDGWSEVVFRYGGRGGNTADAGLRSIFCAGPAEVFLARVPQVRPAEGDDRKAYDYWMPQLMVRRRATAPLASLFLAVHEPLRGKPFLDGCRTLPLEPGTEGSVALEVRHGPWTDTVISTLDEPPYPERRLEGGIVFRGRLGFLRNRGARVVEAVVVEGTSLRAGDVCLASPVGRWEGSIESATRQADGAEQDAFLTGAALPAGDALRGRWMIVTHGDGHTHGYPIDHVEPRGEESQIVLQADHGLRLAGGVTEECFFPRRKIAGTNRFVISVLVSKAEKE